MQSKLFCYCAAVSSFLICSIFNSFEDFYTEWIRIIENKPTAPLPNTAGTDNPIRIWDAMSQIMERFPKYDLQTEEGAKKAIEDIEGTLRPIATFEALEGQ